MSWYWRAGRGSARHHDPRERQGLAVPYPACGQLSARNSDRYRRTLDDLPWHGTAGGLGGRARRFFCPTTG